MQTINPWPSPHSKAEEFFNYDGKCLHTFDNGVSVYKNVAGSYDFVVNGMTVTQRGGWNPSFNPTIDDPYFFERSSPSALRIKEHLRANGIERNEVAA